jgi:hypothetical protein
MTRARERFCSRGKQLREAAEMSRIKIVDKRLLSLEKGCHSNTKSE